MRIFFSYAFLLLLSIFVDLTYSKSTRPRATPFKLNPLKSTSPKSPFSKTPLLKTKPASLKKKPKPAPLKKRPPSPKSRKSTSPKPTSASLKSTHLKNTLAKSKSTPLKFFEVETLVESDDIYSDDQVERFAPYSVAIDSKGNTYVADTDNNRILKITPDGLVSTLAGSTEGFTDAEGTNAQFDIPLGIAVAPNGNVFVADQNNNRIRKISPGGTVTTWAGSGAIGTANGVGTNAEFWSPQGIAVDNKGNVYVADTGNCLIRKITRKQRVTTLAGKVNYDGEGICGFRDGMGPNAKFYFPVGVAVWNGNVFVADSFNCVIRKISPNGHSSTLAGNPPDSNQDNCGFRDAAGTNAKFSYTAGVAVWNGNVYVADERNRRIRKINTAGAVSTVVASATGRRKDAKAQFCDPWGVAVDASGNLYVSDPQSSKILKIAA